MNEKECCIVCKAELDRGQQFLQRNEELKTCASSTCGFVLTQRYSMSATLFDMHLRQQQRMAVIRRLAAEEEEKRIDTLRRQQATERELISQRVFAAHPLLSAENTVSIEVPVCKEALVPLPIERLDSYRRHLERIIDEALAMDIPATDKNRVVDDNELYTAVDVTAMQSPLGKTSETICTLCQGGCCTRGGNIAYLTDMTVLRVRGNNPDWGRDELLRAYLDRLKSETVDQSCVNHSSEGCSLPRELRSDTCNNFYCEPLQDYRRHADKEASCTTVIAVQRGEPDWRRYASGADQAIRQVVLIDENGAHESAGITGEAGEAGDSGS